MFVSPITWVRRGAVGAALVALLAPVFLATPSVAGSAVAKPPPTHAVRAWNLHAVNALVNGPTAPVPGAGQTPPVSEIHLAIVHTAIFDAVNSIAGGYEPYLTGLPAIRRQRRRTPRSPPPRVACSSGSAAGVPPLPQVVQDRLNALYMDALAGIPEGPAKTDGIAAGAAAATRMLEVRDPTVDMCRSRSSSATTPASGAQPRRPS